MNWKNEAIERLRRYDAMKGALLSLPEELKRLETEALSLKTVQTDKVNVKSSPSSNDSLINNLVCQEELRYALGQAQRWVRTTERALSMLLPEEKLVLHRLYVSRERGALDRLCMELGCEQSTVYRKRDQALQRFTIALYGFTETQLIGARRKSSS